MKKYLIITLALVAIFSATWVLAGQEMFIVGSSTNTATSTYNIVDTVTSDTLVFDSFEEGKDFKSNEAYVLLMQKASTSASQIAVTASYSQNGIDYYINNLATTTTASAVILGSSPTWTLLGNSVASSTYVTFKIDTPTRFTKLTFTGLVGTSSVYAKILPVTNI